MGISRDGNSPCVVFVVKASVMYTDEVRVLCGCKETYSPSTIMVLTTFIFAFGMGMQPFRILKFSISSSELEDDVVIDRCST